MRGYCLLVDFFCFYLGHWVVLVVMGFVNLFWGLWRGALLTAAIAAKHVFRGNPLTLFDL